MSLRLTISNISKTYNGKPALKDCSFSFEAGGTYALMGPNGSGKSTLLRICAFLEEPDKGEIAYHSKGEILKNDLTLKRRITLVLPRVGIFNTTVFNNAAYGLKIRGLERKEIRERVVKVLELVGLMHKKSHEALTLSSGEMQRLGIARAMVIEPDVIFFDEPTASIDEKNTVIVENIIEKMKLQRGTTIILATHDVSQAEKLADKILMMQEGRLISRQPS